MKLTDEQVEKLEKTIDVETTKLGLSQYVILHAGDSCLDGDFSAADLRAIANAMDRIAATPEGAAYLKPSGRTVVVDPTK